jgi:hypothetical protein
VKSPFISAGRYDGLATLLAVSQAAGCGFDARAWTDPDG